MNIHGELGQFLFSRLLVDIQHESGTSIDAPDDLSYEWLLVEAPLLEKQVLAYIEGNRIEHPDLPEWLVPLWMKFITTNDALYLRSLRQLLLFCYKIEHEPRPEQLKAAEAVFEETDDMVGTWSDSFRNRDPEPFYRTARQYVGSVIYRINWSEIVPAHGPGSVYPPRRPTEKSRFRTLYQSIVQKYPFDQYFCGLPTFWSDTMGTTGDKILECRQEIRARLTAVPKDSRGPRLICVHPAEAIWIQQGQRRLLESAITRSPLTRGRIDFTDQTVNGNLAMLSSKSRDFCTLDLKEASDRISCDLVKFLFGEFAYDYISCSRAESIQLLSGRVRQLKKWAPMGNAMCFPVQSLVFFALVRAGIRCHYGVNCSDIYVFGDDILFPSKYYEGAIRGLVRAGLVPNMNKTFRKGLFRESCGVDAYNGVDVTPLRMKAVALSSFKEAESLCTLAKRAYIRGYRSCSSAIYTLIRKRFGYLPLCNNPDAQGLVEYVDCDLGHLLLMERRVKYDQNLQMWRVPCRLVVSRTLAVRNGDWYHLQDALLRLTRMSDGGISDRGTEYAVPYSIRLKYGWAACYVK